MGVLSPTSDVQTELWSKYARRLVAKLRHNKAIPADRQRLRPSAEFQRFGFPRVNAPLAHRKTEPPPRWLLAAKLSFIGSRRSPWHANIEACWHQPSNKQRGFMPSQPHTTTGLTVRCRGDASTTADASAMPSGRPELPLGSLLNSHCKHSIGISCAEQTSHRYSCYGFPTALLRLPVLSVVGRVFIKHGVLGMRRRIRSLCPEKRALSSATTRSRSRF